jgi:hypothetical protein
MKRARRLRFYPSKEGYQSHETKEREKGRNQKEISAWYALILGAPPGKSKGVARTRRMRSSGGVDNRAGNTTALLAKK